MKVVDAVGIVVLSGDKVLLVKHGEVSGHINDRYGLPAGHIDPGETAIQAAIRELEEETGIRAITATVKELPQKYYAEIERKDGSMIGYNWNVFVCMKWTGELKSSDETVPEWHRIEDFSELELLPNVDKAINQAKEVMEK